MKYQLLFLPQQVNHFFPSYESITVKIIDEEAEGSSLFLGPAKEYR